MLMFITNQGEAHLILQHHKQILTNFYENVPLSYNLVRPFNVRGIFDISSTFPLRPFRVTKISPNPILVQNRYSQQPKRASKEPRKHLWSVIC